MKRASQVITAQDKQAIEAAIAEAEKTTQAELVVVVATQSGRYDRGEDIFAVIFALLATGLAVVLGQRMQPEWGGGYSLAIGFGATFGLFIVCVILGAFAAAYIPALARPFISLDEMLHEIRRSAFEAFHRFRMGDARSGCGVLIYVSLFERHVWVVGDNRIASIISDHAWAPVRDAIIDGFREERIAEGFTSAIARATTILGEHFPATRGNANEIPNEVHILD